MLNIKHPEADRIARTLARQMGETITEVVIEALREKLLREQARHASAELKEALLAIAQRCAKLPNQDSRVADEIIGYDKHGLPIIRNVHEITATYCAQIECRFGRSRQKKIRA